MAFQISERLRLESRETNLIPNIVLKIEGVDKCYGAVEILKVVQIGDPGLEVGNFIIGGQIGVDNQGSFISYQGGTSTNISQKLNIDKGLGESVSSMRVALVDKNGEITNDLLVPGNTVPDILGVRARLYFGFQDGSFPDDYITIFRGNITSVNSKPGLVIFNINNPEEKKRSENFIQTEAELTTDFDIGDTVINVTSTSGFLLPITGPDGSTVDADFSSYVRIDDEIIKVDGATSNQFNTITRGQFGTVEANHDDEAVVESFYRFGPVNVIDCALKYMLSGKGGPYVEELPVTNFVRYSATELQANTMYFQGLDLVRDTNVQLGDFITTTGATNAANNVSAKPVTAISVLNDGILLEIGGVSFVEENGTSALVDIRSQYDVWPDGLAMNNDEVDIAEHLLLQQRFLSSPEYDFYIKDTIEGKDFLAEQVYNPVACYSLPRKSQASLGFHSPPIPGTDIKLIDTSNVLNPKDLKIIRSTSKNFKNNFIYRYEELPLEEKYVRGVVEFNADSQERIKVGNKSIKIDAKGLREVLSGANIATQASDRRLKKYAFGAEYIQNIKLNLKTGFNLEIGDILIFDMGTLKVSDIQTGTRSGESRLFQVDQKKFNLKTGLVSVDIVDTNFNKDARFGLISPSSFVAADATTTSFNLKPSYNTVRFGTNEGQKWVKYIGAKVIVRSSDFTVEDQATLVNVVGNKVILDSALSFTPSEDYIFELDTYTGQIQNVKLVFAFMTDDATFPEDGEIQYGMI